MSALAKSSKQTASKIKATKINKTKPVDVSSQNTTKADVQNLIKIISNGENNIRQDLIILSQQVQQLSKEYHELVDLVHKTPKRIFSRAYKAISNYWSIK